MALGNLRILIEIENAGVKLVDLVLSDRETIHFARNYSVAL